MEITQDILREKIKNGDKVVVEFWGHWCGPCRLMKPTFEKVAEQNRTQNSPVQLYTMDIDDNKELVRELGIRSIPTIKTFANGVEVSSYSGVLQEMQINSLVNNLINE